MKLLAIDLDGTTLTSQDRISKKTMNALEYASQNGVIIVPCTGRCLDCFPKQLQNSDIFTYAISSNGARVSIYKTRETLYREEISNEIMINFLEKAPKMGITAHVNHEYKLEGFILTLIGRIIRGKDTNKMETVKSMLSYLKESKKDVECMQLFMFGISTYKKVDSILKSMKSMEHTSTNGPSKMYMELYSSNTSKGKALQFLADYLHIRKEDIYCIGDGDNDLSMFEVAGMSFAVQNAAKEVKEKANMIVPSHNADGVAFAIKSILDRS